MAQVTRTYSIAGNPPAVTCNPPNSLMTLFGAVAVANAANAGDIELKGDSDGATMAPPQDKLLSPNNSWSAGVGTWTPYECTLVFTGAEADGVTITWSGSVQSSEP